MATGMDVDRLRRAMTCAAVVVCAVMAASGAQADQKTVILVPTTEGPNWRDMAYLAAIPAGKVANASGMPAVLTLDEIGTVTREVRDYLDRYKPDRVLWLSPPADRLPMPIVAHYRFDERTGRRALDSDALHSGPHTATLSHFDFDNASVEGAHGSAVRIRKAQQRIELPNSADLAVSEDFTLAFWMKSYDTAQAGPYLLNRFPAEGQHGLLYRNGHIETQGGGPGVGGRVAVTDERWHHYAFVNDGKSWRGYRDGELVFTESGFNWKQAEASPWVINKFGALDVALDDLRVYGSALSAADVEQVKRGETLRSDRAPSPPPGADVVRARSAEEAAYRLAARFWDRSRRVVLCRADDYKAGLSAACLAARIDAPLLLWGEDGALATEAARLIGKLGAGEALVVGADAPPRGLTIAAATLADDAAVMAWMVEHGVGVDYIALANPHDRTMTWSACGRGPIDIRKVSLAAPLLAAGRGGAVALLDEPDVQFKRAFRHTEATTDPAKGAKACTYRYDPAWLMPRIGRIFTLNEETGRLGPGFTAAHHPVNGRYAHAVLMSHLPAAFKGRDSFAPVWMFAAEAGAKRYDRIAVDLDLDGVFTDREVFKAGDAVNVPTLANGVQRLIIEQIGGDGVGDGADSAFFVTSYPHWYVGELALGDTARRFAMRPALHVPFWNSYHYTEAVVDLDGDGDLRDETQTFATGDEMRLGDRTYDVSLFSSLDSAKAIGQTDAIYLTYPTRSDMRRRMLAIARTLGRAPDLLCIVALPSAIPYGAESTGLPEPADILTDLHWGQLDDDPFLEVGVGRFFSEDHRFTTLAAARSLTYNDLVDPAWAARALSVGWAPRGLNTMLQLENVGVDYRLVNSGEYLQTPGLKHDNLKDTSMIWHAQHADASSLGAGPSWGMQTLLAPAVITSGGCMALAMDWVPPPHNAASRWLRNGGVALLGGTRQNGAQHTGYDYTFWQKVIEGRSLGQAYRAAINHNRAQALVADGAPTPAAGSYENFAMVGDPGLRVHIPAPPRVEPARVTADGDRITARAPEVYWDVESHVEQTKKQRTIQYRSGPGLVPKWPMIVGYRLKAEHRAPFRVTGFTDAAGEPVPHALDHHADGTTSVYWFVDFDPDRPGAQIEYRLHRGPETTQPRSKSGAGATSLDNGAGENRTPVP